MMQRFFYLFLCFLGSVMLYHFVFFFFQAEDGIRDHCVTGVQTCALPIYRRAGAAGGRGVAALRAGHDLRHLHRHVLLDLHRRAAAHVYREALAGPGRARRPGVPAGGDGSAGTAGSSAPAHAVEARQWRAPTWSTPTATWSTWPSIRIAPRCWNGRAR